MKEEEILCDDVETVRELTCPGDRETRGGGCETGKAARTGCGWFIFG